MDIAILHLWSAGYDLPAKSERGGFAVQAADGSWTAHPKVAVVPRRGKKAAKAKRERKS